MKEILLIGLLASAQVLALGQSVSQRRTDAVWADPDTGLSWTPKDNGADVSWKAAGKYCHKLTLGGFSDWRLPSMSEAQSIFDEHAESPGTMGLKRYNNVDAATWHVKGGIFLTGKTWTALSDPKEKCGWTCYAPHFNFNDGKSDVDPAGWPYPYDGMRVLCVRGLQVKAQIESDGASS